MNTFLVITSIVATGLFGFLLGFIFGIIKGKKMDTNGELAETTGEILDAIKPADVRVISPSQVRREQAFAKDMSDSL